MPGTKSSKEKKKGKKTESSRNNVLYLILTLKRHSDRNHPLTVAQITEYLNQDFAGEADTKIAPSTVKRLLDSLYDDNNIFFRDDDACEQTEYKDKNTCGFYLRRLGDNAYLYYYESWFLDSELQTIYDSIETYNYLAKEDISNLSQKLSSLRPLSRSIPRYLPSRIEESLKDPDSILLENVSLLAGIIEKGCLAEIDYGYYDVDLELKTREGYPKTLRPLRLIFSNGYYYCLMCMKEKNGPAHLRVDRILGIEEKPLPKEEAADWPAEFRGIGDPASKSSYRMGHPGMYGGPLTNYTLLIRTDPKSCFMNLIVDNFGRSIQAVSLPKARVQSLLGALPEPLHQSEEWVEIHVQAAASGMEIFAAQYCDRVAILSPKEQKEALQEKLRKGLALNP